MVAMGTANTQCLIPDPRNTKHISREIKAHKVTIMANVPTLCQLTGAARQKDPVKLEEEIRDYCRQNMAPYKVPKIIEFIDAIPLTAVGKVDKKVLR